MTPLPDLLTDPARRDRERELNLNLHRLLGTVLTRWRFRYWMTDDDPSPRITCGGWTTPEGAGQERQRFQRLEYRVTPVEAYEADPPNFFCPDRGLSLLASAEKAFLTTWQLQVAYADALEDHFYKDHPKHALKPPGDLPIRFLIATSPTEARVSALTQVLTPITETPS